MLLAGVLSDSLIKKNIFSIKNSRRFFNDIGLFIPVASLIGLSFVNSKDSYIGVILLTIGIGFLGFSDGGGFCVNINDIGGQYSGLLFGISNTFATIPGIIAPYIVSIMTPNVSCFIFESDFSCSIVFIL
jgi:MFS transporter, ACS family, solute carrier family 17 (sodium-dependent inorganic phosphate cotransporter), member 5